MDANEQGLFAALATKLRDLQRAFTDLSKQPGPIGLDGKKGDTGPRGADGDPGVAGKDGQRGDPGPRGAPGKDGRDGIDGAAGATGDEGPIGPMPKHQWRGSELRFQQTKKKWGSWVDLRGPSGGGVRMVGVGGDFDPSALPNATDTPTPTEIIVKQDGVWVRASWTQFLGWVGTTPAPTGVKVNGESVTVNGETVYVNGA